MSSGWAAAHNMRFSRRHSAVSKLLNCCKADEQMRSHVGMKTKLLATTIAISISGSFIQEGYGASKSMTRSYSVSLLEQRKATEKREYSHPYPFGGTFFELENGQVAFFSATQHHNFRSAFQNSPCVLHEKLLMLNLSNGKSQLKTCTITVDDNRNVDIDGGTVTSDSMDRTRLSKKWDRILQYRWPRACSTLDLGNGRFLISGGFPTREGSSDELISDAALVVDANKTPCVIEKTIKMTLFRSYHSTALLPDGTVLCIGGEAVGGGRGTHKTPSAEIIDIKLGKSTKISTCMPVEVEFTTVCLDKNGNPLVFGGHTNEEAGYTLKDIVVFDAKTKQFRRLGTMRNQRFFPRGSNNITGQEFDSNKGIENCAARLKTGQYLVDGGVYIRRAIFADFITGTAYNAEIITLPDH